MLSQGAAELNAWITEAPDVLYLSFSACTTYAAPILGSHLPLVSTNPMFMVPAAALGRCVCV